eukprot:CAMPEP_0198322372 /NCGR_PEP_ID=MMETSP1450-20131203/10872_1 /TAXON_ID=753684 ORGANISM="Madagascaria erythrocladiodes, Strain CCMP3234" /NCGR_SAMPLE_ID=MMETSP1450 /ASSEMBLY_ACC=CAM_ASM_001115 /LENGTH=114 /DNA_ID=CAMNT_0044025985 /DNA_START=19 /DNA_END=360 /DNA_ORIENTATION=+
MTGAAAEVINRRVVCLPGGGVKWFHQAGAVKALMHYNGSKPLTESVGLALATSPRAAGRALGSRKPPCAAGRDRVKFALEFAGASAGALSAVLAASDVDFDAAVALTGEMYRER